jgi:CSLREA domain-containing protein
MKRQARLLGLAALVGLFFMLLMEPGTVRSGTPVATLTVNTLADTSDGSCVDGTCSLRDAILVAGSGDTINFGVAGTIVLAGGPLSITRNLTINGPGAGQLTVSGNNAYQVLYVDISATVGIAGLTIANGYASFNGGGGAGNDGTLTINQCVFASNNAGYYSGGGAIANLGTLTVSDSTFVSNTATGISPDGGGIDNEGVLVVVNSTFSGNHANWYGGAIYSGYIGGATVRNSTFFSNTASSGGGGIYAGTALTVTSSLFLSNSTTSNGGAIYTYVPTFGGAHTVDNCTFDGNTASDDGGGIENDGPTTVSRSTFTRNSASQGGGIDNGYHRLVIVNSSLYDNHARDKGGGLANWWIVVMTNTTFVSNTATNGGAGVYTPSHDTTVRNTLVANGPADPACLGFAFATGSDHNLATDATCGGTFTQTTLAQLALLGPVGSPAYFVLGPSSAAIDVGNNTGCPATDQPGTARPKDGNGDGTTVCDVGAYEALWLSHKVYMPLVLRNP